MRKFIVRYTIRDGDNEYGQDVVLEADGDYSRLESLAAAYIRKELDNFERLAELDGVSEPMTDEEHEILKKFGYGWYTIHAEDCVSDDCKKCGQSAVNGQCPGCETDAYLTSNPSWRENMKPGIPEADND